MQTPFFTSTQCNRFSRLFSSNIIRFNSDVTRSAFRVLSSSLHLRRSLEKSDLNRIGGFRRSFTAGNFRQRVEEKLALVEHALRGEDDVKEESSVANSSQVLEKKSAEEEVYWQRPKCRPVPASMPNEKLLELVRSISVMGRSLGFKTASEHLEYFLSGKGGSINLAVHKVATAPLVLQHLGPSSNPNPSESDIRNTIVSKEGLDLPGEHHVVFLGGILKRLENGSLVPGQRVNLKYEDSIDFYGTPFSQLGVADETLKKNHEDLGFAVGGGTIESKVEVETFFDKEEKVTMMRYTSWKSQFRDPYNWDKIKVADLGPICIPDEDLTRLQNAGFGKEFLVKTSWWDHKDEYINSLLWFPVPFQPPEND